VGLIKPLGMKLKTGIVWFCHWSGTDVIIFKNIFAKKKLAKIAFLHKLQQVFPKICNIGVGGCKFKSRRIGSSCP
jgi:hypothetical protein